jgi:hypothetical protein
MIEHIAVVVLGLAFVVEKAGFFIAQRAAARERRELYSRIQAGTLGDFAAHQPVADGISHSAPTIDERPDMEEMIRLRDELPDEAFVEAQAGFNSLMG